MDDLVPHTFPGDNAHRADRVLHAFHQNAVAAAELTVAQILLHPQQAIGVAADDADMGLVRFRPDSRLQIKGTDSLMDMSTVPR